MDIRAVTEVEFDEVYPGVISSPTNAEVFDIERPIIKVGSQVVYCPLGLAKKFTYPKKRYPADSVQRYLFPKIVLRTPLLIRANNFKYVDNFLDSSAQWLHQYQDVREKLNMEIDVEYVGYSVDEDWKYDTWEVYLRNITTGRDMQMTYRMGVGHRVTTYERTNKRYLTIYDEEQIWKNSYVSAPTPLSILESIHLDDFQDMLFEDWVEEYGYDPDSRKAENIYRTCVDQTLRFKKVFPGANIGKYLETMKEQR